MRRADVVERMGAEIIEAELRGKPQRRCARLDRGLVLVREHLVARDLAEHRHLDARRRSVRDQHSHIFETRDRIGTSSLLPQKTSATISAASAAASRSPRASSLSRASASSS